MTQNQVARCRSCGAEILWARIATLDGSQGRTIPLDVVPERRFVFLSDDIVKLKKTYVTHFASGTRAADRLGGEDCG